MAPEYQLLSSVLIGLDPTFGRYAVRILKKKRHKSPCKKAVNMSEHGPSCITLPMLNTLLKRYVSYKTVNMVGVEGVFNYPLPVGFPTCLIFDRISFCFNNNIECPRNRHLPDSKLPFCVCVYSMLSMFKHSHISYELGFVLVHPFVSHCIPRKSPFLDDHISTIHQQNQRSNIHIISPVLLLEIPR